MKAICAVVVALLLVAVPSAQSTFPIEKVARGVVQLWMPEIGGGCSAAALGSDYFATAAHCTEAGYEMTIFSKQVQVVISNEDSDVAVVRTVGAVHVPPFKLGPEPKRGDPVLTLGFIGKRPALSFFPGIINDLSEPIWYGRMLVAGVSGPGMSGGAVINTKGELVGVHQGWVDPTESNRQGLFTYVSNYAEFKAVVGKFVK
jgi:S1-C subfamily serine protease